MDRDTIQSKLLGYEQLIEEMVSRDSRIYHVYGLLISKGVLKYENSLLFDRNLLARKISKYASSGIAAYMYRDNKGLEW